MTPREIKNDRQQSLYRVAGPTASNAVVQRLLRTVATVDSASQRQMAYSVSAFQSAPETFKVLGQMCMAGWLIKVKGGRYQITQRGLDCLPKAQTAQHMMTPDEADRFIRRFAAGACRPFSSEELVATANACGLSIREERAWDAAFQRAAQAGVIRRSSETYRRTKGNGSIAFKWERVIQPLV